ncbi:MAG: hypothetical protein A2046_13180 [Bacteroidetes bacterium GWA2_30_7]|nr:MAG: hypothetical protein A2046_13180 [Bacteroidetes bacterium GWA2_30_7]
MKKYVKIYFISLISLMFVQTINGQKVKLDSLWEKHQQATNDTTRIKLFIEIGEVHKNINIDSAMFYYQKAIDLTDEVLDGNKNNEKSYIDSVRNTLLSLKGTSLRYIGNVFLKQSDYDKALIYYQKAMKVFEDLDKFLPEQIDGKIGMSLCYNNIGSVHYSQGSYTKAIDDYLESLKINEEIEKMRPNLHEGKKGIAKCYTNIGNVYSSQNKYEKALEYYFLGLKIREELGDKKGMSYCYMNINSVYHNMGEYDKALEYYMKAVKIDEEL